MIRNIVHDPVFLAQKSQPATKADLTIARDMKDTLQAHASECVGMAANMIGELKNIIIFDDGSGQHIMFNPVITKKAMPYDTEEGCLSISGVRKTQRYKIITVKYQDEKFAWHEEGFMGFTAQIIQHECDHLEGVLI